jgi:threonine dehydratase
MIAAPALADIEAAAGRIAPLIVATPLLSSAALDELCGGQAHLKAECLQRFGSFKLRGATNKIAALAPEDRARGVLAFSSGNHAIATAAAARHFGASAVIVMPADAPAIKRDRAAAMGAEIIAYDRISEDREAIGARIVAERGLALVKPFDDPFVIAGQGTIGLEIANQLEALDLVLVCTSGGGLVSGIATAVQARFPAVKVYAVEPEGHDDLARSLAVGARVKNAPGIRSICDALMVDQVGELTFSIMRERLAGSLVIPDAAVRAAMRFALSEFKLVLEPGGAIALAALLSGAVDARGKTVAVIASGGNVDLEHYRALIGPDQAV